MSGQRYNTHNPRQFNSNPVTARIHGGNNEDSSQESDTFSLLSISGFVKGDTGSNAFVNRELPSLPPLHPVNRSSLSFKDSLNSSVGE